MQKIGEGRYQKVYRTGNKIIKFTKKETDPEKQIENIKNYYLALKATGIKTPEFYGHKINSGTVETYWEDCGTDLRAFYAEANQLQREKIINQLTNYSKLAQNIAFYPIFEQFTIKNNVVYFVDFYPSRTEKDFLNYTQEKKEALNKLFFGIENRINTIREESKKYINN